ncbi:MAG: Holliday junction branch migration protein RuvA [Firmicutes bacterium]|nr:Holliday junction branch migration protein RuvA [Bacillota bacterium]
MFNYIKGSVVLNECNYIVIDNNGIGYQIYVANPFSFEVGCEYQIYLYNHIREDEFSLYGFKTLDEKNLFMRLINVKGLGPKMALPMLATGSVSGIIDAIDRENILYLTKFPKIGDKLARQIVLDLKGKINIESDDKSNDSFAELIEALEALGYKHADIKKVIPSITEEKLESQIKEALRLLLK